MTFAETFFDFDEEVERFDEAIGQLQDKIAELEDEQATDDVDNSQQIDGLTQLISQLQSQRKGVIWARDRAYESEDFPGWDEDVDGVTLGALRAGAYGGMRDDIETDPDAGNGTTSTLMVAEGTVDAPYIDDGMSDVERVGAVANLHPYFREWAEGRINALIDPESSVHDEGNGNDFADSLEEKQRGET